MKHSSRIILASLACGLAVVPLAAQKSAPLDRSVAPPPGPTPAFVTPSWTMDTLANGARLVVVEKHDLPIVNFSMHFAGGTDQLGTRRGTATFIPPMMREGTEKRAADQLTNDLALLGATAATNITFGIGAESGTASFSVVSRKFDQAAELMIDMMLHSTFPAASLERLRTQSLANYARSQDAVGTISNEISPKLLYGDQPYGQVVNDADLKAVTRDDVANLAKQLFVPANATVYVVGDMTRARAKAALNKAFAAWPASGNKLVVSYPAAPAPGPTTIYMVDMPDKPQSQVLLAHTVPPQYGPDMPAATVMNLILGGLFNSRLNHSIREVHGFSYGFNSTVSWLAGPGAERAQGAVTREKTDSTLILAMQEIKALTGSASVSNDELTAAKNSIVQSLPGRLQSVAGVTGVVARIVDDKLPKNWWSQYIAAVNATTGNDVAAMARKYMDPDHLVILVVGDGAKIMASVKATGVAPVMQLDKTGKPVPHS